LRFLLSLGDDECRFAVLEADDPLAGYTDTLNQRFVDKQDSASSSRRSHSDQQTAVSVTLIPDRHDRVPGERDRGP